MQQRARAFLHLAFKLLQRSFFVLLFSFFFLVFLLFFFFLLLLSPFKGHTCSASMSSNGHSAHWSTRADHSCNDCHRVFFWKRSKYTSSSSSYRETVIYQINVSYKCHAFVCRGEYLEYLLVLGVLRGRFFVAFDPLHELVNIFKGVINWMIWSWYRSEIKNK